MNLKGVHMSLSGMSLHEWDTYEFKRDELV